MRQDIYIYIYMYMCVCVCVCVCDIKKLLCLVRQKTFSSYKIFFGKKIIFKYSVVLLKLRIFFFPNIWLWSLKLYGKHIFYYFLIFFSSPKHIYIIKEEKILDKKLWLGIGGGANWRPSATSNGGWPLETRDHQWE